MVPQRHGRTITIAMRRCFDRSDYSVAIKHGKPQNSWRWEINCAGKSLPIERSPIHFPTISEANRAEKRPSSNSSTNSLGNNAREQPSRARGLLVGSPLTTH